MANIHWNWKPQAVAAYIIGLMNINNIDINNDSDLIIHLKGPFGVPGQELFLNTSITKVEQNPTIPYHSLTVDVGRVEGPIIKNFGDGFINTTTNLNTILKIIGVMSNIIIPDGELVDVDEVKSRWILSEYIIRTMLNSSGVFAIYEKPWGTEHYKPTAHQLELSINRGLYVSDIILYFPINSNDAVGGGVWLKLRTNTIVNILLDRQINPQDLLPEVWFFADFTSLSAAHINLVKQQGIIPVESVISRTTYEARIQDLRDYETYYTQIPIMVPQNQDGTVMANPPPQSPFVWNNANMNASANAGWNRASPVSFTTAIVSGTGVMNTL